MQLYKITIKPLSNFVTSMKGDTLFGQLCWAIRYSTNEERLEELLKDYDTNPFMIVSDGFASGYLPKPTLPSSLLHENSDEKKKNRKKIWLTLQQLQNGKFNKALTDKEIENIDKSDAIVKNSINYKTFTTGEGFDPHSVVEFFFSLRDIYILIDNDRISKDDFKEFISLVGEMGYGKDSSIGKGRFEVVDIQEISISNQSMAYMAISPFSAEKLECKNIYYEPFTRFGKSGASRATKNPFKKPILMANSGAVIEFKTSQKIDYVGKAINDIAIYKDIVHQGYSIVLPLKELSHG